MPFIFLPNPKAHPRVCPCLKPFFLGGVSFLLRRLAPFFFSVEMQKRSQRSSSRKPAAATIAGAAAVGSDGSPLEEKRESLAAVLTAGDAAVEESEVDAVESDDDGMIDGDAEEGEWDDGFEESSDEGVMGLEGEDQQEVDPAVAALR